jgi:hypothetical protein
LCATAYEEDERVASLHGAAHALFGHEEELEPLEAQMAYRDFERLKARLGADPFIAAFEGGCGLTEQEAIALALRDEGR